MNHGFNHELSFLIKLAAGIVMKILIEREEI